MDNQVANLTVGINSGNAEQRLANLERALLAVFNAGNQSANGVENVGQSARQASGNVSTLAQVTANAVNQASSLNQSANNTSNSIRGLGASANRTNSQVNTLSATLNSASSSAQNASANLERVLRARTNNTINAEIMQVHSALLDLDVQLRAGTISQQEFNRMTNAGQVRLQALRAELNSTGTSVDTMGDRAGTTIGKLKGMYAGLIGVTTAITGATAAGAVFVKQQIDMVDELTRLARVANSTTTEVQKYTFGAKTLGVETDKLGDVFKDTQDKIGDFLTTGGGELADFFKYIAPQIGITAEQLRGLSGPDALQAVYNALEKSNLSYSEQVFYMESLADEASSLIPLLRNNGEGFRFTYEQAKKYGAVLDEEAIKKTQELKAATGLLGNQWTGIKNQVAGELIPVITDLVSMIGEDKEITDDAKEATAFFVEGLKILINTGLGVVTIVRAMGTGIGALGAAIMNPTQALDIMRQAWDDIQTMFSQTDTRMGRIAALGSGFANPAVQQMVALQNATSGVNAALSSTNEKLLALTGNTAFLNKNGSVHLDVRYANGDARYGKELQSEHLNRLLLNGMPISQSGFAKTSGYGNRVLNGKSNFHEGYDYATPMNTKVSTKVPVKSLKTWDNRNGGGGWVTTVEFMDGVKLNLLHLSPQTADVTRQYLTPNLPSGKTGQQIQASIDAQKKQNERIEADNRKLLEQMTETRKKVLEQYLSVNGQAIEQSRGLPMGILAAVMEKESQGNLLAKNKSGALGLMQLMPKTAKRFFNDYDDATVGTANDARRDPLKAVTAAADYLAILLRRYGGNLEKALAAYNAGEGNVDSGKYKGFKETRSYVPAVKDNLSFWQNSLKTGTLGISGDSYDFQQIQQDAQAEMLRQQQEAAKLSQEIRDKFASQKTKIGNELKAELGRIANSDMSADEKKTYSEMAEQLAKRKIAAYEYSIKATIDSANASATTATQKVLNDFQSKVINAPEELLKPVNAVQYEAYVKNLEKEKDLQLELLDIGNQRKVLESQKQFMAPIDYEAKNYPLLVREIKASNSEIKDQELENARVAHEYKMDLLADEEKSKLLELNRYRQNSIAYALELQQLNAKAIARSNDSEAIKNANLASNDYQTRKSILGAFSQQPENLDRPMFFGKGAEGQYQEAMYNAAEILRIYDKNYADLEARGELHGQTMIDFQRAYEEAMRQSNESILEAERNVMSERLGIWSQGLDAVSGVWGQMTDIITNAYGKQSAAARAFFFVQKTIAAAQAVVNTEEAATKALAQGGALFGVPMATIVRASGYASAGIILGQGIAGAFGKGFMTGGYTGNIPKDKVAGPVHGQEFVLNAQATRNIGLPTLNAMNRGQNINGGVQVNNYAGVAVTAKQENGLTIIDVRNEIERKMRSDMGNPNSAVSKSIYRNSTARPQRG